MQQSSSATQFLLRLVPLSLVLAGACARGASSTGTDPRALAPPPGLFRLETAEWSEPYSGPLGYPKGAQRASLGVDSRTGGETYYARFPAGTRFELHWHAHAEYAVVLRGRVTHTLGQESTPLMPGDYVVIPPKMNHGWAVDLSGDAYILIRRDGPPDFNFIAR
jgi:mannose-6-phosphate isomerase-like protein (cupin superfamily)